MNNTPNVPDNYDAVRAEIIELLQAARRVAARRINSLMTTTYWEIGRRIVQYEQGGGVRADYGQKLVEQLANDRSRQFGRGFGRANFWQMRAFYRAWPEPKILQTLSGESLTGSPLFRPRRAPGSDELAARRMTQRAMHRILTGYLERLPRALREKLLPSGEQIKECIYSPHSLPATTATLLLDAREPIESVQDLLDHKHITTTQIYDKLRRSVRDSASHKVAI